MSSSFFGPSSDRSLTEADMSALPSLWMTSACMDGAFRRLAGWLGLAPTSSFARAFTCRLKKHPGAFGVFPVKAEGGASANATFRLFYFPTPDDPMIDRVSLPAAVGASSPERETLVRDFPSVPDFAEPFSIGEMSLVVGGKERAICLTLSAPSVRRIRVPDGLAAPQGGWLVEPGGLEEDLPAFTLAQDVFAVLAAGLAAAQKQVPKSYGVRESAGLDYVRLASGALESVPSTEAKNIEHILDWGQNVIPNAEPLVDQEAYRVVRVAGGAEEPTPEDESTMKRPRLVVVNGFLGSGKTSFLNQFIEFHLAHDQLVGVIQNEIGETGVDAHLLEGEESVLAMDAGCVCCSLAGTLLRGIRQLSEGLNPEIIVLETTGLANPMNMIDEFHHLSDSVELAAIVTLVDAERFHESLAASDIAAEQIRAADLVVLNKCDLIDESDKFALEKEIKALNPEAQIVSAVHGRVNPSVLGEGLSRHASAQPELCCGGCVEDHSHGITHSDEGFSALRLNLAERVDRAKMLAILQQTPSNVMRIKGLARFADADEAEIVQYVPGHAACELVAKGKDAAPFVLIIGRKHDHAALQELWKPLLKEASQ